MSEPKLTPGPWEVGLRRDGSMWLSLGDPVTGPHYQGDIVASFADACLIAAAPDMYRALENIQQNMNGNTGIPEIYRLTIAAICDAALSKARGEE